MYLDDADEKNQRPAFQGCLGRASASCAQRATASTAHENPGPRIMRGPRWFRADEKNQRPAFEGRGRPPRFINQRPAFRRGEESTTDQKNQRPAFQRGARLTFQEETSAPRFGGATAKPSSLSRRTSAPGVKGRPCSKRADDRKTSAPRFGGAPSTNSASSTRRTSAPVKGATASRLREQEEPAPRGRGVTNAGPPAVDEKNQCPGERGDARHGKHVEPIETPAPRVSKGAPTSPRDKKPAPRVSKGRRPSDLESRRTSAPRF